MLIDTSARLITDSPRIQPVGRRLAVPAITGGATCTRAPIAMMLEIALVTLMSGVWSAGVTFQTTWYPTKQAKTNTVK